MDDILKDLGWGDGFRIPVANEENRALELEIQKKQKEKENLSSALEVVLDRLTGMKSHMANVKHQLDQNQNVIFAYINQKAAEENLVKLARNENKSLAEEMKKIKNDMEDTRGRQDSMKADISKVLKRIEKLNTVIKWDKEALLTWDEEVTRGDDDTQMLEKFMREDETKFKELELKRQCLGMEMENKKNRLMGLKNDVISMEQSLDKTAQLFRRHHFDRKILVQQWESSVRILHQRDEDINRTVEEIGNLKSLAKDRIRDLEEQKIFFENEEKNNKELHKEIEVLNRKASESREKTRMLEMILWEEADKLATLKTVLATSTTNYHSDLGQLKNMNKEIEARDHQELMMKEKLEKAKEEYNSFKDKKISAEERVHQIETMLKEEEGIVEKNLLENKKLDDLIFQVTQQIKELKDGEKTQVKSMEKIQAQKGVLIKEIEKAKIQLAKEKEMLYNMDFAFMEKDMQLNRMLGVEKDQDSEKHDKRITELEAIHSKLSFTNNLLTKEVLRLEEEMRRLTIDFQADSKEQEYMRNKRQENGLLVECGQKQLKSLKLQNEDKQVDENVLKVRVRQAEKAIDKVGGKVFSLEKQRLELEQAMKEREIEIKTLRDVLQVRRRVLLEQMTNLNSRINLGKVKVEHLKNKFEVAVFKLGKDENGEPLSVTHLKIKSAQERFELQELGDKLDSKIKKTEKEIEAMENTLKVVNATNKAFKNNLQSVDLNSPEQMEKEEMERTQADLASEFCRRNTILEELGLITTRLKAEYEEKEKMKDSIMSVWQEKEEQIADNDKELREQAQKLERADKQLKKLIKDIRGTRVPKFQTVEEKDIELRELMEQNEYGLQQLAELVAKTYDTEPVVTRYLAEKGLALPMVKSPAPSLKCPSTASISSPGRSTTSSKSSDSISSRLSSCAPSVVTLDSTKFCEIPSRKSASVEKMKRHKGCPAMRKRSGCDERKRSGCTERKRSGCDDRRKDNK